MFGGLSSRVMVSAVARAFSGGLGAIPPVGLGVEGESNFKISGQYCTLDLTI